jgi:integrase
MSIERRQDSSSWVVRWRDNNNVQRYKNFRDKKYGSRAKAEQEAKTFEVQIKADLLRGEYEDPHRNKISLADFKHEVGLTRANHKESTKRALENTWNSLVEPYPIADMSIGSIRANNINNWIANLRKPNGEVYSRSALDKALEVVRVLLDSAVDMDLIKKNPAKTKLAKQSLPRKIKTKKFYLNEFQVRAIEKEIEKTHPIYSVMIPLMAYTGLRSGEARALTWEDIDFENGTLTVNKSIDDDNDMKINYDDPKTNTSIRTVNLTEMNIKRLINQKANLPADCVYVFPNQKGNQNGTQISCTNPIRARNLKRRALKPALERLGYDSRISLHDFRHTSVYLAVKQGVSMVKIQKRLGHKSIMITADTYSELFDDVDQDVAKALNELDQLAEQGNSLDLAEQDTKEA